MSSKRIGRPVSRQPTTQSRLIAPAVLRKTELFDHIAREHDGFAFTPDDSPRLELLRARLGSVAGKRILEPGCGTGHLTTYLAEWVGPDGQVVAFDSSAGMIERTRLRTATLPQVHVHWAAIEKIDLPASAFDLVVCFRVWPHFDDGARVLRATARWLRPGGRLLIVHWEGREKLAAVHGSHHSVAADIFPPRPVLESALLRTGFALRTWIDTPQEIFIEATAVSARSPQEAEQSE